MPEAVETVRALRSEATHNEKAKVRLPTWLKRQVPRGNAGNLTEQVLRQLKLETVCENARCPNRPECYAHKTATFMILGNVCTRPCGFCAVRRGKPLRVAEDEPERVAEAARRLALRHVVITSVTRDDLPDGGSAHFCRTVRAVRARTGAAIEVLTPDFGGDMLAVDQIVDAQPDVFNHNLETVPRLYSTVRRNADYRRSLKVLARVKHMSRAIRTKSGIMLGLGETLDEVLDLLADLRDVDCNLVTVGQYLQPSAEHLPVKRYVPPDEFDELGHLARRLGFEHVASGPFVRSSYHAAEMI
jgi:lipoic acid synthetase